MQQVSAVNKDMLGPIIQLLQGLQLSFAYWTLDEPFLLVCWLIKLEASIVSLTPESLRSLQLQSATSANLGLVNISPWSYAHLSWNEQLPRSFGMSL